jgi:hypothetical protein
MGFERQIAQIGHGVQIPAGGASIKQLRSESVVNYPVLIQQIEIPFTSYVHAPHRLLAYY